MPLWQQHLLLSSTHKITVSVKSPRSQKRRQALKPSQRQSVPNLITCLIFAVVCPPLRSSTLFITRSKLASVFQSARAIWKYRSYQGNPILTIPLKWSKFTATYETNSSSSSRITRWWKWRASSILTLYKRWLWWMTIIALIQIGKEINTLIPGRINRLCQRQLTVKVVHKSSASRLKALRPCS